MKAKTNKKLKLKKVIDRASHSLAMMFIPHKKNGYRPHLIRRYGLVAIFFVVLGLQFGYNMAVTGKVLGNQSSITITSLLNQTNEVREDAGYEPLALSSKLDQAAYLKVQDMFTNQYWAHNAPDGTPPWKWLGDVEYNYDTAGENLAKNFTTTEAVMTAWMNSPEHKENILNRKYNDVGFALMDGYLDGKSTSIIVVFFGRTAASLADTGTTFTEASSKGINIFTQFAVAVQSINPATSIGLLLILMAIIVSVYAHKHRRKLPRAIRNSWRLHHGLYKSVGLMIFGVVVILLFSSGQV
ncbi:MAG: CAP domain-containing protein [Candidatus Saccharimonadales bacterium]